MNWKRIFTLFIAVLLVGSFSSAGKLLKTPAVLLDPAVKSVEEKLGARLSFQEPHVVFFPFLGLRAKKVSLEPATGEFPPLAAEDVSFSLRFFSFLWGRPEISGFHVKGGEGILGGIPLEKIDLKVRNLGPHKTASFEWKASAASSREALKGKGQFVFQGWDENFWMGLALKADFLLTQLSLEGKNTAAFSPQFPKPSLSGELGGRFHLEKEKGKGVLNGLMNFELKDFRFENSSPFPLTGEAALFWDPASDSVEIQQVNLIAPFAELAGKGIVNIETGEIGEVRLTGRKLGLDEWVKHFPSSQSLLPVDTGFSGESGFDLTLQGTLDHLSLHASIDLTPAVLTYGEIFSKPKEDPLGVSGDLLLKKGSILSGDFSVRIRQTTVKGTLVDVDLKSGQGELTLLTNKFELEGWETLLPLLAHYKLRGAAKIFFHCKGDLNQPGQTQKMLNVTLDKAAFLSPEGRGIRSADLLLDVSDLNLKVKTSRIEFGETLLEATAEIYSLHENPQGNLKVTSPELDPYALAENLKAIEPLLFFKKGASPWAKIEAWLARFLPQGNPLKDFTLNLKTLSQKVILERLSFQAWGGDFRFHGESDWASDKPSHAFQAEFANAGLARYFEALGTGEKILQGNLFLNGRFKGRGFKLGEVIEDLTGEGTLSITNGEWQRLDFMSAVKDLDPFQGFSFPPSLSASFSDLKANWNYAHKKFETKEFLVYSPEMWVEGEGNLSLEGTLNARLALYLSRQLTKQVFEFWQSGGKSNHKQLGPFPLLLVGTLARPEVKPDERRMSSFMEDVRARRLRRILATPFAEGG